MALAIKQSPKEITIIPEGSHVAILYSIVDLGTQEVEWQGQIKYQAKVRLTFELPNETKEFEGVEKPLVIGAEYTLSLSDKARLKPVIEGIRGKRLTDEEIANFSSDDFSNLVGKSCMLSVLHTHKDGATYANIASVSPVPKGMTVPKQFNESTIYEVSEGQSDKFKALPEFMRNKIMKSQEMNRPRSDEESLQSVGMTYQEYGKEVADIEADLPF
jgi:hypothetical protein